MYRASNRVPFWSSRHKPAVSAVSFLRLLDREYVGPENLFPRVADEDHKLTCRNGVGINAPRLLSGPSGQVVDVRDGRIGQDELLPQPVFDDGSIALKIVIGREDGRPSSAQGGEVRIVPLLRAGFGCW